MNIVFCIEAYIPYTNGVITHVSMLKESLTKMGHRVLVITADPNIRHHKLENGILYCPAIRMKKIYGYGLASFKSPTRMKLLKAFKPDVIHVHNEFGISLFGVLAAKKLGIPLVYTLHTMYDDYFHYVARGPLQGIAKKMFYRYIRFIANNASVLASPSKKAEAFFASCKIDKPVNIIPNTIDTAVFDNGRFTSEQLIQGRRSLGIPDDALLGVFVGRLGAEKSVDYVLDVFAKYFADNNKMQLLIIGDGPDKDKLAAMADELGISKNVHFLGKIDHSEIPYYFSLGNYYVTASLTEMMSISMLEAMSVGLPAVMRYDEKNASQFTEGENGFTFRTKEQMRDILNRFAQMSPEEREQMHSKIRAIMRLQGSDQTAEFLLGLYNGAQK